MEGVKEEQEEEGTQQENKVVNNQSIQNDYKKLNEHQANRPLLKLIHASNHQHSTFIKVIFTDLLASLIQPINNNNTTDSDNYLNKPLESFDYSSFHRLFILLKYTRNIMDLQLF